MFVLAFLVSFVLLSLYIHQIWIIGKGWDDTPIPSHDTVTDPPPVSILIACRNEGNTLPHLLDALLSQTYEADKEIVIIDDASTDNTLAVAKSYQEQDPKIIQVLHQKTNIGKKNAIHRGIDAARHDLLVFTDADCIPHQQWLATMTRHFQKNNAHFMCGPVEYVASSDTALEQFQYMDGLNAMAVIASGYHNKKYINANGGNMMYTKQLYHKVKGFENNDQYASGDDVFMAIKAMDLDPAKVHFCKSPQAMVRTSTEKSLAAFLRQRKRWASKTKGYSNTGLKNVQIKVALLSFFSVGLALASVASPIYLNLLVLVLIIKAGVDYTYMKKISKYSTSSLTVWGFVSSSLLYPFYMLYMSYMAIFPSPYVWKGTLRD